MTPNQNPTRSQAAANTRKLIEWAVDAAGKPLPEPVRRRAAIILSDDIGAMVAGSLETQVARAREGLLRTSSGEVEATVLAKGAPRADRYAADVFGNHTRPPGADAVLEKFRTNAARSLNAEAVGQLERATHELPG